MAPARKALAAWLLLAALPCSVASAQQPQSDTLHASGIAGVARLYNFNLPSRDDGATSAALQVGAGGIVVKAPQDDDETATNDNSEAGEQVAETPHGAAGKKNETVVFGKDAQEQAAITPGPPINPANDQQLAAPLYLEVFINGNATNLIAEFVQLPDGGFAARAKELDELGLTLPSGTAAEELVALRDLGAQAHYNEEDQRLDIRVDAERLKRHVLDLAGADNRTVELTPSGTGMVLNYSLLAAGRGEEGLAEKHFDGISGQFEGWIYSPLGTLFSSVIAKKESGKPAAAVRLDTHWQFVDLERSIHYQVGDLITSGPHWARSVRMGGVQVRKSFKLRPDVITAPLPKLSATAAVPTAIDVYVNNLKVHSGKVEAGPFEVANIPALSRSGVARLVMRDAAGREVVREQSFYVSPELLRADLFEFSLAAGMPRRHFGEKSFDYDWRHPGFSASMRYGVSDALTVQAHMEAARHLILGGAGVNFTLFDRALFSVAAAASHSRQGSGLLSHFTAESHLGALHFSLSSLRTFGQYADLSSIASARAAQTANNATLAATQMPRAVESLNVGYAFSSLGASLSAGLVHVHRRNGTRTRNLNIGYSQKLFGRASLYATALFDFDDFRHPTLFAGLTMPLGADAGTLSATASRDVAGGYRAALSYDKAMPMKDNAVGWRARVTYGDIKSLEASLAWRTPYATVRGSAMQVNKATIGQLGVEGALVLADGALFASNRINDAFAVVNAGAPNVQVRHENRPVGKTRFDGRMLLTSLRSLQRNKISIDPETMPVDAIVEDDKTYVTPALRSGVVVNFKTKRATHAALVVLHDQHGRPVETGAEVKLQGAAETFIVGYDGETYLEGLKKRNILQVRTLNGASCRVTFSFISGKEVQPRIGPLTCRLQ